jgi:hypothetical protein
MRVLVLAMLVAALAGGSVVAGPVPLSAEGELSISGTFWEDLDMDGYRDDGEPVARGAVFLLPENQHFRHAVAGADGRYTFDGLEPGAYLVRLNPPGYDFVSTYPARVFQGEVEVVINLAASVDSIDFGWVGVENVTVIGHLRPDGIQTASGVVTEDGVRLGDVEVKGFIGGQQCAFARPYAAPADTGPGSFSLLFAPDLLIKGCGRAGDIVHFTVNGRSANETITYPPASETLNLTVGESDRRPPADIRPPDTGDGGLR